MKSTYKFIFAAILACMLSYCSEKPQKTKTSDISISLAVQEDVLKAAINRRLLDLEKVSFEPEKKPKNRIRPVDPLECIHPIE